MNRIPFTFLIALLLIVAATVGAPAQEPNFPPALSGGAVSLPPELFVPEEAGDSAVGFFNIKHAPFGAKGDGVSDDSEAFIRAWEFIQRRNAKFNNNHESRANAFFIPNGTYLITRPIMYGSEPQSPGRYRAVEAFYALRLLGEQREKTIIRLAPHSPAFQDRQRPAWALRFSKRDYNNGVSGNRLENLTVSIGPGNPGVCAVGFHGANDSAIRHVTIVSEDGRGVVGLDYPINMGQGVARDILVRGFDYGIRILGSHEAGPTFEHVTLEQQKVAGILPGPCGGYFRKVSFTGSCPALVMNQEHGHAVLLESTLRGGGVGPAIQFDRGHLFLRDVEARDYQTVLQHQGNSMSGLSIKEYSSDGVQTLFPTARRESLRLPVEEMPELPLRYDPATWVSVEKAGERGTFGENDSAAIEKALAAGKPVVYFPTGRYLIDRPLTIPAHVQRILFFQSQLAASDQMKASTNALMVIEGATGEPLFLEDLLNLWKGPHGWDAGRHALFHHASPRTVVMSDCFAPRNVMYQAIPGAGNVFLENVASGWGERKDASGTTFQFGHGQRVWARFLNPENQHGNILVDGAALWVFGFKTEEVGTTPVVTVRNGGALEMLGGMFNTYGVDHFAPATPAVLNDQSRVSVTAITTGPGAKKPELYLRVLVREKRGGEIRELKYESLPQRDGGYKSVVPLYVGGN